MASSSNENGNLMDEFEEAFQSCLLSLTKQEPNTGVNKEDVELEVQKATNRFIDVARQMEAFFLRKRFLVSTLKPDMLIKDENQDLRIEISRKEILLNKHYNRLEEWKACLSDLQQNQGVHNRPVGPMGPTVAGGPGAMAHIVDSAQCSMVVGGLAGMAANRVGAGLMQNMPPGMGPGAQLPPAQQQHLQSQLQQQKVIQQQLRMRAMSKSSK